MSDPILFLRPRSRTYLRDYQFAHKVYRGTTPRQAADDLEMSAEAASKVQQRLRETAARWAGRPVSDPMIYRLMFDRARAEADLKETCPKSDNRAAKDGAKRAK